MKKFPTVFLQAAIVLLSVGVFAFMLWEPHLEGRNVNATAMHIYFNDPFLAYAYVGSIAFFVALYQTFKVLGYIRADKGFSPEAIKAVRTTKYCAGILAAFIIGAEAHAFIFVRGSDDIAGGVAMGLGGMFLSLVVAAGAAVFEKLLQSR